MAEIEENKNNASIKRKQMDSSYDILSIPSQILAVCENLNEILTNDEK